MKTRSFILGITAFLFAMGSAFASLMISDAAQVADIKVVPLGETTVQCISSGVACNESGDVPCEIQVELPDSSTPTVLAYIPETSCTEVLRDNRPVPNFGTPISIQALAPPQ